MSGRDEKLRSVLHEVAAGNLTPDAAHEALQRREPLHVITVRVPKSIHEEAKKGASEEEVALNTFCLRAIRDRIQSRKAPTDAPPPTSET